MTNEPNTRLIRIHEVMRKTGLSRTTIYRYIQRAGFPKPVTLDLGASRWAEIEVDAWIRERMQRRSEPERSMAS